MNFLSWVETLWSQHANTMHRTHEWYQQCNKWHYVLRNLNVTPKKKKKQMD
jgi:hypothetical protein